MAKPPKTAAPNAKQGPLAPFRRAVLRGLGVLLPPLLTIVILIWAGNTVMRYLLEPVEQGVSYLLVEYGSDIRGPEQLGEQADQRAPVIETDEGDFVLVDGAGPPRYVPADVLGRVNADPSDTPPATAKEVYRRYVELRWGEQRLVIRVFFICVFVLLLYLLGKFLAAGIGRFFWNQFERLINQLPLVRNIYSSVKQITDFLFSDREMDFNRVVAVEYPRKGIWTVAFVTGESMLDIESAANEPVMSLLIPTSPMPFTGFTITVKKSETVDLDLSIDQALQFVVSCGVVVPPQQTTRAVAQAKKTLAGPEGSPAEPADAQPALAARTTGEDN